MAKDDELILAAVAGDRRALEILLHRFHDPLLAYIRSFRSGCQVEEVLQETFIDVFRHISKFDPRGPSAFERWLKVIAANRLRSQIRAARAAKRGGGVSHSTRAFGESATRLLDLIAGRDPTPSRVSRRSEAIDAVVRAVAGLEPDRQQVIELRYGKGLSIEAIAAQTARSQGSVKMLLNRAMKDLRRVIGEQTGEISIGA